LVAPAIADASALPNARAEALLDPPLVAIEYAVAEAPKAPALPQSNPTAAAKHILFPFLMAILPFQEALLSVCP
jgi:hypothetical protein